MHRWNRFARRVALARNQLATLLSRAVVKFEFNWGGSQCDYRNPKELSHTGHDAVAAAYRILTIPASQIGCSLSIGWSQTTI